MDFLPIRRFQTCVSRYRGDHKVKEFRCLDQFLCMAFAQITYRESLRDIEDALRAAGSKLYHMGIRTPVRRSTLADANENRDWRIYADFAQVLIAIARELYADEDLGLDLNATVYALDSTTIELSFSLFPWARYQRAVGAIKLHTLLDLRGSIPQFLYISDGKLHDVNLLDLLVVEPGSFYIMDRGYLDFGRLYAMHRAMAYFVTRAKRRFQFQRRYSHPVQPSTGVRCDQTVLPAGVDTATTYPDGMRRIVYVDAQTHKKLTFLTNNFALPALTITQLYRARWQVELFFKWIKQHLSVESFWGRSPNAVKTQICVAISTYLLVLILKKKLRLKRNTYEILQILSVSPFDKTPIVELISNCTLQIPEPQSLEQARLLMF
jgi:hypothetical protein